MKIGNDAIQAADFPLEFAAGAAQKAYALRSCLSIRAGQPPNMGKPFAVSPKPMAIKTKTTSSSQGLPLVAGFIPVDQETFGRSHSKPLPNDSEQAQLKMNLQELLRDVDNKKYEIVGLRNGYLEFRSVSPDKEHYDEKRVNKNEIVFRINLRQDGAESSLAFKQADALRPWHKDKAAQAPEFWQDSFGKFDNQRAYAVEYRLPNQKDFQPLQLAAINGNPVTGDADMLSVAVPIDMERNGHGKMYDASIPSQRVELFKDFVVLLHAVSGEKLSMDDVLKMKIDLIHPKTLEAYDAHAKFMSRMENEAPKIEKMLNENKITEIEPQKLADLDKYMKCKDSDQALKRDIAAMNNQFKDGGLADVSYVENKREFTTGSQPAKTSAESTFSESATSYRRTI